MLDERHVLGGLQVGGPRTGQNPARFRVANNVYQTRDGYYVPRSDSSEIEESYTGSTSLKNIFRYQDSPFVLGYDGSNYKGYYESTDPVVAPYLPGEVGSLGVQAVEKLGNLYFNFPQKGMFKFDGFHCYRAGVPLPYFSSAQYASSGNTYVRVLQHHIDFNGNVVHSGYVQFRATPNGSGNIVLRTDKGASEIVGQGPGTTGISPVTRNEEPIKLSEGYMSYYYKYVSETFDAVNQQIVVTTGGDHNVAVGAYIIVSAEFSGYWSSGLPFNIRGLAHKVKAFDATTVTLDLNDTKCLTTTGEWVTTTYPSAVSVWPGSTKIGGSNYWQTLWASDSETGVYYYRDIFPCFYESPNSTSITVYTGTSAPYGPIGGLDAGEANNCAFNLTDSLGEVYDVTTVKMVFPYGREGAYSKSFSTYDDSALMAYANEIYFSDTSLGGSFEMVNGLSFIVVGEGDDGEVQSVCGSADYFLVSREFKNYYVTGNLATANYKPSEISSTSLGTYSNESVIAINDKIIFMNAQGVWALYAGGRCDEVSENIRGFFKDFANTQSFSEEAFFDLDSYPTYASEMISDQWIRVRHDVNRGLLLLSKIDQSLVLNMNNGEFYTWSELANDFQDICFIDGYFYLTEGNTLRFEDKFSTAYMAETPVELETTWFTAKAASLEKKLNQLKIWGRISSNVQVRRYLDWTDESGDPEIYNPTSGFSHKKRIAPANFLAVSIGLEFSGAFEIEGLEIEFQPFQEGMKR